MKEKQTKPHILITNDDGIESSGLKHLFLSLEKDYQITIVAPSCERSCCSVSSTISHPIEIRKIPWSGANAYSVSGTTADCVKLATSSLEIRSVDLVVSGINPGSNSGRNILYSGTVGGIIEATIKNIPGIAFASESFINPKYKDYEKHISEIVAYFLKNPLPQGTFLNVTLPSFSPVIRGCVLASQGKSYWTEDPEKRKHPEGHDYYWLKGKWKSLEETPFSDNALLKKGYITIVPITIKDLTDHTFLQEHAPFFDMPDIKEKEVEQVVSKKAYEC
jgi:5'-nucleotidase